MRSLENKIALVTGGARGIGRAISLGLASEGAHVAFSDLQIGDEGNKTKELVQAKGVRALALQADVRNFASAQVVVDDVVKEFQRVDILVNNAGITRDNLIMRMTEEEWDLVLDTNLKGTFNYCRAVSKYMISQRQGKIINISSVVGLIGNPGQVNYSASKAGIIGLTKTLAKELASRNIQVNSIAPGFVETSMTEKLTPQQREALLTMIPMKRTAQPEEIAGVVVFFASPAARYITGQVLCVDGGLAI